MRCRRPSDADTPVMQTPRTARRDIPLVFVKDLAAPELTEEDHRHLTRVRRLRPGQELTLGNGNGQHRPARLSSGRVPEVTAELSDTGPLEEPITIAFTPVKGDRPESTVAHLTELGADEIVILRTERSVVRFEGARADRQLAKWAHIVRQSAAQSRRLWIPRILGVLSVEQCLSRYPEMALAEPGGQQPVRSLRAVAIGPEGGWSDTELIHASTLVNLPGNILRAETAALAAATVCAGFRSGILD